MDNLEIEFAPCSRPDGARLLQENYQTFANIRRCAKSFLHQRKYEMAAVYAEIAAAYASTNHCGLFASVELEEIVKNIGREALPPQQCPPNQENLREGPKRILHVATVVLPIGGHSRMLWRWIQRDSVNVHSVVLTRQIRRDVPEILKRAVEASGGELQRINGKRGRLIDRASALRAIANAADIVVLHVHGHDVIPLIAFADPCSSPPVMLVNHSDHIFWLGATTSNVVANLRESGMRLSQARRAISPDRNVLLPIPLENVGRKHSRTKARRALGLPEDGVMLLCIARSVKFKSIDGISYADAHVAMLKKHKNAYLVVIGKGSDASWDSATKSVDGRVFAYPEREDTELFYNAADIYVDSFPFVSITSLLEAGNHGLPLITRNFFSSTSEILGADAPGLSPYLIRARDSSKYTNMLSRLVEERELRVFLGEKTRARIAKTHVGTGWLRSLIEAYKAVSNIPRPDVKVCIADYQCLEEPDVWIPPVYGEGVGLDDIIRDHLRVMPFPHRFRQWRRLLKRGAFRNRRRQGGAIAGLVSELWVYRARRYLNMIYRPT